MTRNEMHRSFLFFFNDTATTEIYTLSLHDALPIYVARRRGHHVVGHAAERADAGPRCHRPDDTPWCAASRSEEHTSELQSRQYLVCRLLLEKKKNRLRLTWTTDRLLPLIHLQPCPT